MPRSLGRARGKNHSFTLRASVLFQILLSMQVEKPPHPSPKTDDTPERRGNKSASPAFRPTALRRHRSLMKEWGHRSSSETGYEPGSHREAQSGKPAPPGFEQLREMPGWAPIAVGTCFILKDWLASRRKQDAAWNPGSSRGSPAGPQ